MKIELTNEENELIQQGLYVLRFNYFLKFRSEHKEEEYQKFAKMQEDKIDKIMRKLIESEVK